MKRIIIIMAFLLMVLTTMRLVVFGQFKNYEQTSTVKAKVSCLDGRVYRNMSGTTFERVISGATFERGGIVNNLTTYVEMPDGNGYYPTFFSGVYHEFSTLLDTLEKHLSKIYFSDQYSTIEEELLWTESYCSKLCRYYYTGHIGREDVSDYAKVDSVLNYVTRVCGLLDKPSNWQMAVNHSMLYVLATFRDYLSLRQMLSLCKNKEEMNLLISEWRVWEKLENSFIRLWDSFVNINYYGGSICKVLATYGYHKIAEAHIENI